jgi:hypothetical protein
MLEDMAVRRLGEKTKSDLYPSHGELHSLPDDHQIAGLGFLKRQPDALEPGARPVLSFINQDGV